MTQCHRLQERWNYRCLTACQVKSGSHGSSKWFFFKSGIFFYTFSFHCKIENPKSAVSIAFNLCLERTFKGWPAEVLHIWSKIVGQKPAASFWNAYNYYSLCLVTLHQSLFMFYQNNISIYRKFRVLQACSQTFLLGISVLQAQVERTKACQDLLQGGRRSQDTQSEEKENTKAVWTHTYILTQLC